MPITADSTILNGKYRILRLIGEGGMARVWLAEELTFGGRLVALKGPKEGLLPADAGEFPRRFQQEINITAQMMAAQVPGIVPAWTVDPIDDAPVLVMKYMSGGSLEELLANHPEGLPLERAMEITLDVLRALDAFHDLPTSPVHRDVKPSNILFDAEGRAHLADFGLAQLPGMSGRSHLLGVTHPHTPLYAAPEQLRSPEPLLPAADLFALGCVVFEMLTGKRYKAVRPGTTVSDLQPEVPEWLAAAVAKALEADPWDRWQSAAEMAEALRTGMKAERRAAESVARAAAEENRRAEAERIRRAEEEDRRRRQAGQREQARAQEAARAKRAQEEQRWRLEAARKAQEASRAATAAAEPTPGGLTRRRLLTGAAILGGLGSCGLLGQAAGLWSRGAPAPTLMPPRPSDTPRPTATARPTDSLVLRLAPGVTMESVRVSAGTFLMGSTDEDKDAWDHEKPQRSVHLDEYLIGSYPVTVAQWRAFVQASGYQGNSRTLPQGKDDHPVVYVSWEDAQAFCAWASEVMGRQVQLPTEAQWEKAARGTDGRIYPWSNQPPNAELCNFGGQVGDTTSVGRYSPAGDSPYGCADMAGNVWEWVADWYDGEYYQKAGSSANPTGFSTGQYRVVRGGSWYFNRRSARCASRGWNLPLDRDFNIGFRVLVALPISQRS